jgi:hypothetical protein
VKETKRKMALRVFNNFTSTASLSGSRPPINKLLCISGLHSVDMFRVAEVLGEFAAFDFGDHVIKATFKLRQSEI